MYLILFISVWLNTKGFINITFTSISWYLLKEGEKEGEGEREGERDMHTNREKDVYKQCIYINTV